MAQSSGEQAWLGSLPSGLLVALLLGLGAVGWVQTAFEHERPTEAGSGLSTVGLQDVDARLWQDPFAAVIAARKQAGAEGSECVRLEALPDRNGILARSGCIQPDAAGGDEATKPVDVHSLHWLAGQIEGRVESLRAQGWPTLAETRPVTVLGIMVPGDASPEAAEARRRERYAALWALRLEEYLPLDPNHIGYVEPRTNNFPQIVPYEWLKRRPISKSDLGPRDLVLVWIAEDSLGARGQPAGAQERDATLSKRQPLKRLSDLLSRLVPRPAGIEIEVIGPASSETLKHMWEEYREHHQAPTVPTVRMVAMTQGDPARRAPVELWSPFATIPDGRDGALHCIDDTSALSEIAVSLPGILAHSVIIPPRYPERDRDARSVCVKCTGIGAGAVSLCPPTSTRRSVASDDELVERLVTELREQRGISGHAGIALVDQWDSPYSRRLVDLFEKALYKRQDHQEENADAKGESAQDARVFRLSFMRGLDGQVPGARPKDKSAGESKTNDQDKMDANSIERSEGDAQTDYLRRMRNAFIVENDRRRQKCGLMDRLRQRCGIRAIGVLGDDYYDKLLVLQALKPVLPNAVFFTTDLNADMLHPHDNSYTRNLIVASGFGLTLAYDWQREAPPLRDTYQTALLLTVRLAIRHTLGIEDTVRLPPPPRLFEIGRTQAVELIPTGAVTRSGRFSREGLCQQQDPHPEDELDKYFRAWPKDAHPVLPITLSLLVGLALFLGMEARGRPVVLRTFRRCRRGFAIGTLKPHVPGITILVTLLLACLCGLDLLTGGEPFSLYQGVSVWPSEILRFLAGVLAIVFFYRGYERQRQARKRIRRELPGLTGRHSSPATVGESAATDGDPGESPPCEGLIGKAPAGSTPIRAVWAGYTASCRLRPTLRRIRWEGLGFLGLAACLMLLLGFPNHPTRSGLSMGLDIAIILLVLVPFLALLFYMVDATRQSLGLARDLRKPISWPAQTLEALGLGNWTRQEQGRARELDLGWLKVKLIGALTGPIGNLVWYPVLVLILIALGRHPLLDAWAWSPALILIMTMGILYAVGCAWALRRAAEGIREDAVRQLSAAILRAQGDTKAKDCIEPLKIMLSDVVDAREGAFRPFTQQPVVQALLTLASSMSGLALLQYSSMANL